MTTVDCHVHVNPFRDADEGLVRAYRDFRDDFDRIEAMSRDPDRFVDYLDTQDVDVAGLVYYVSDVTGFTPEVNEFAASYRDAAPDRLFAFGGVDLDAPVADIERQLDRLIDLDLAGVKLHPPHQDIAPNAYRAPPVGSNHRGLAVVYERCTSADIPVLVHTGPSVFPGARSLHGDPLALDDVCVDFGCPVILAHAGRPFHYRESDFLLRRHGNLYLDLSSIPPHHVEANLPGLAEYADRTMFGSDWPGPSVPDIAENVAAVRDFDLSPDAIDDILGGTAVRLFDL